MQSLAYSNTKESKNVSLFFFRESIAAFGEYKT